jgi:DNA-binding LacI/PurR family transcriptional regulator
MFLVPTLADVAKAVGVSRTTVSNAYSRPDQLSAELRDRILDTARTLGYAGPDPLAQGLRRGRTGSIALVSTTPLTYVVTDPAMLAFMTGVAKVCDAHGVSVVLLPANAEDADRSIRSAAVDGFITYCNIPEERYALLRDRGLPFVQAEGRPDKRVPGVRIDDRGGAAAAAAHLAELGHRQIAVLVLNSGDDQGPLTLAAQRQTLHANMAARLAGYRAALTAAGLAWSEVTVVGVGHADSPRDGGLARTRELLLSPTPPTAILAMSDAIAFGAMAAATELGFDVPGDLSIVGFDDVAEAARTQPGLTTVHQDLAKKGEVVTELLFAPQAKPAHIVLPCHLVVRASTAPPAQR